MTLDRLQFLLPCEKISAPTTVNKTTARNQ